MMVIPGASVAEAEERRTHILAGADQVAVRAMAEEYGMRMTEDDQGGGAERLRSRAMMGPPVAGPAAFVADRIEEACREGDLDGVMLEMPDYLEDQRWIGEQVLPILRERGLATG
jgi:pyrimidine oxygenase